MKNKTIFLLAFLFFVSLTSINVFALANNSIISYYKFDSNSLVDSIGVLNLSNGNATYTSAGKINGAFSYEGAYDYLYSPTTANTYFNGLTSLSVAFWVNLSVLTTQTPVIVYNSSGATVFFVILDTAKVRMTVYGAGSSYKQYNTSNLLNTSSWIHVVTTWTQPSTFKTYINGVEVAISDAGGSGVTSLLNAPNSLLSISRDIQSINGIVDEVAIFGNRVLNSSEVVELYNNGTGLQYPFTTPVSNFTLSLKNTFDNSAIKNFSANIDGIQYDTITGSIVTNISINASVLKNVSFFNISDLGGFYNVSYLNYNLSSNLQGETYQANVTFKVYQKITSNSLSGNVTNGSSNYGLTGVVLPWNAGTYNVTFYNSSHFNNTQQFTVNALTTGNIINITGIYNSTLNIYVLNYTAGNLSTFNGWVYNSAYGFNESFSTITGVASVGLINGLNYLIYVESNTTAIANDTNYKTLSLVNVSQSTVFVLNPYNSIFVLIKDEITGNNILTNSTLTLSGNTSSVLSVNNSYNYTNLTTGTYSITVANPSYQSRIYDITVTSGSTQSLTAYLLNSTYSASYVTFTLLDSNTGGTLNNVSVIMSRLINNTWMPLESKMSDISGRAQFNFQPLIKYQFTLSKINYDSQVFYLNPVIFSSYNLRMDPSISTGLGEELTDVSITYGSTDFSSENQNNFTFSITSAQGSLSNYNVSIVYPGGSQVLSGTNALGESFDYDFNISNATLGQFDKVNLTYCFLSTLGPVHCYNFSYDISGIAPSGSWKDNVGNTYGLGLLERLIIVTICVVLVAGFFTLFIGSLAGGVMGLFLFGFFVATGFVPLWAILPSLFVGFFIFSWRSSQ